MARSDTTQDLELAVAVNALHNSSGPRLLGRLGQCAAGISTCALGITVAAMAAAQSGGNFKVAPKSAEAEAANTAAADTEAASVMPDAILGIPVNTLFFVAAGVLAVLWFTLGGGRKAKVSRN